MGWKTVMALDFEALHHGAPVFLCPKAVARQLPATVAFDEVEALVAQLNACLRKCHVPLFPTILAHLVLPTSPLLVCLYYRRKRCRRVQALLDAFNTRHGAGLKLALAPDGRQVLHDKFTGHEHHHYHGLVLQERAADELVAAEETRECTHCRAPTAVRLRVCPGCGRRLSLVHFGPQVQVLGS